LARLIEVLVVEAYHHIEGNKLTAFLDNLQELDRPADYSLVEIHRNQE
jgi:hypothetical protein